jgi:hypothetical protein
LQLGESKRFKFFEVWFLLIFLSLTSENMSSSKAKNQAGSSINAGGAASAKAGKPSSLGSGK